MSYSCQIIADSKNTFGDRITTMKITFPRFILAEFNTHRMFSRNSASSRAIPFKKMVKMVEENPFIPIAWQKDHKGMQGTEYLQNTKTYKWEAYAVGNWLKARDRAIKQAEVLNEDKVTKQLCNRLLEPFMWHTVIVTSTEWENFFKLRCPQYTERDTKRDKGNVYRSKKDYKKAWGYVVDHHSDLDWLKKNESQAEIHIQAIAELMWDAYNESIPKDLQAGEWHIPFGDNIDTRDLLPFMAKDYDVENPQLHTIAQKWKVKIATARCARISYETLGDNPKIDYEADIRLHDILLSNGHASPLEHCARAMQDWEYNYYTHTEATISKSDNRKKDIPAYIAQKGRCRNFKGFIQYRALTNN